MNIAVDLPTFFPPSWEMAAGALQYADRTDDIIILLPHARMASAEDKDPQNWDAVILREIRPELDIPQVSISSEYPEADVSAAIDEHEVVRLAVDQFVSMGIRNFGFFAPDNWNISNLRWQCFSELVEKQGATPVYVSAWEPEKTLYDIRKPCGILAVNDNQALWLMRICALIGLRVPGDIHIISVDDSPACLEVSPTLSSISMPFSLVGFHAARLCVQLIQGELVQSLKIPPSGLILRESIALENDDIKTATEIAHYLRTNLSYPIQMEDIVRRSNVSRRLLEQVFREAYGSSPIAYLKELRLARAKELLSSSDTKLKDIVNACGYRDSNHLCRVFRERLGISPMAYRQSNLDKTD